MIRTAVGVQLEGRPRLQNGRRRLKSPLQIEQSAKKLARRRLLPNCFEQDYRHRRG